jgi:hypothetical protein
MSKKLRIHFPMGAGGKWLKTVLHNDPLDQASYVNFHMDFPDANWVILSHNNYRCDLALGGAYSFNFFCNQVYKHLHWELDYFSASPYSVWFYRIVIASAGITKLQNQFDRPYFDWHDLLQQPDQFLHNIHQVQAQYNQPQTTHQWFDHARALFLNSCVNVEPYYNNFDSVWWVAYCVGQLSAVEILPGVDITQPTNFDQIKDFAWQNRHSIPDHDVWVNSHGPSLDQITIPNFRP